MLCQPRDPVQRLLFTPWMAPNTRRLGSLIETANPTNQSCAVTWGSISSWRTDRSDPKILIFWRVRGLRKGETMPNASPNHTGAFTTYVL